MDSARPLHEVFDALSRGALDDPVAALRDAGHDLPAHLLGDAVAYFAGTADVGVAEHLAPFVTAHAAGEADPADGLALLASAPSGEAGDIDEFDVVAAEPGEALGIAFGAGSDDLDFGSGAADIGGERPEPVELLDGEPLPSLPAPGADTEAQTEELPELFGTGSPDEPGGPDEPDAGETDLDA